MESLRVPPHGLRVKLYAIGGMRMRVCTYCPAFTSSLCWSYVSWQVQDITVVTAWDFGGALLNLVSMLAGYPYTSH